VKNDVGYVSNEIDSVNGNDLIFFGKRDIQTITNTLDGSYIFSNKSSLSLRLRHYLSQANYDNSYYQLLPNGELANSDYVDNHDITFSSFNIDLLYTWYFAPGSEMTIAWKNIINTSDQFIFPSYLDNLENTFDTNALNSLSVKLIYYLDYNYLKRS